jgi:hypothetical protein
MRAFCLKVGMIGELFFRFRKMNSEQMQIPPRFGLSGSYVSNS